jgi:hypothetical protein
MNTLEIKIGAKSETILYPSSWNELTRTQLIDISKLFLHKKNETLFRVESVMLLIGRKTMLFKKWVNLRFTIASMRNSKNTELLVQLTDQLEGLNVSIYRISETLDFLFKENALTKNLIEKFKGLHGPSDLFGNVSLIEYLKADIRCKSYENTGDEKYLNELIAVMYRPAKYFWWLRKYLTSDDDPRQQYGDKFIKNSVKISRWPLPLRNAIYLYFKGCMAGLMERYPNVFKEDNSSGEQSGYGMAGLITALAGEKFGNPEQTASTMLHHILIYLEQDAIIAEKIKSKNQQE